MKVGNVDENYHVMSSDSYILTFKKLNRPNKFIFLPKMLNKLIK